MAIKTETLTIKVSPVEKKFIQEKAAQNGTTVSAYLYSLLITTGNEEIK